MVSRRVPRTESDPVPVTDALDDIVRSLRGTGRSQVGGVFGRWDEVVGPAVAAHVRPLRLDERVLVVEVDDPTWATQVELLGAELRARLATELDVHLDRLEVRVAGHRKPRSRDTPLVD